MGLVRWFVCIEKLRVGKWAVIAMKSLTPFGFAALQRCWRRPIKLLTVIVWTKGDCAWLAKGSRQGHSCYCQEAAKIRSVSLCLVAKKYSTAHLFGNLYRELHTAVVAVD